MSKDRILWVKPSGVEIMTNAEKSTVEYVESLGWKRVEEKKRPGRPAKKAEE